MRRLHKRYTLPSLAWERYAGQLEKAALYLAQSVTRLHHENKILREEVKAAWRREIAMTKEHEGLPVKGYRPQSEAHVALANEGKELEERTLRWIEKVQRTEGTDPRLAALGFTNVQAGFMWAVRSIFQPGRIALPEDDANGHD